MTFEKRTARSGRQYLRCMDCWGICVPEREAEHDCPRDSHGRVWRHHAERTGNGGWDTAYRCPGCGELAATRGAVAAHECGEPAPSPLEEPVAAALETWSALRTKDFCVQLTRWMEARVTEVFEHDKKVAEATAYGRGIADTAQEMKRMLEAMGIVPVEEANQ